MNAKRLINKCKCLRCYIREAIANAMIPTMFCPATSLLSSCPQFSHPEFVVYLLRLNFLGNLSRPAGRLPPSLPLSMPPPPISAIVKSNVYRVLLAATRVNSSPTMTSHDNKNGYKFWRVRFPTPVFMKNMVLTKTYFFVTNLLDNNAKFEFSTSKTFR